MHNSFRALAASAGLAVLASCTGQGSGGMDIDLRGMIPGTLNTAPAAQAAQPRPAPDAQGVITFQNTRVAVARQGDTITAIAARLGLNAAQLASYNAIAANVPLHAGAVVALPGQPTARAGGGGNRTAAAPTPAAQQSAGAAPASAAPRQHVVTAGETAWSIARRYSVSVADLAAWNGLPSDMSLRPGQRLLIPVAGLAAPASASAAQAGAETRTVAVTAPGTGSPTPQPPSASRALPTERTPAAATPAPPPAGPDLGATRTAASTRGRFTMPVNGPIIRPYAKGRNEGIDIAAPAGTRINAAASGRVAAITRDTEGTPIVVVRHENDMLSVYAGMDDLTVSRGDAVSRGQALGKSTSSGVLHFEIRRGFDSVDPEGMF
ncbi:MAG: LysM peptidoglycan-binding domain-containing protein [Paracoccus sp. (in: a-proteobacteria)]|uniref:LysM peptidoglycan-binding domain-containing protein n=1 Tax=Paracoccus sp. TaxID=267 RepID=UPI0026E0BCBB|nr:LysM peptidoglycan-binding domain-containing protein [Paracoccus sp. (in: a-proteobacteria)]MDO5632430.1 LysM peptidoglycan-binding domain-containing protein [Paracoccus sp. (in: a-proteobacteria)]